MSPLLVVFLLGAPAAADASSGDPGDPRLEFRDAENAYLYGDYARVVKILSRLVDPEVVLTDPEQVAQAYERLGLAHSYLRHDDEARIYFEKLIRFRPGWKLNPALVPPTTVRVFDSVREALADELERERQRLLQFQREEEEKRRLAQTTQVLVEKRRNSRLVALVPFGAGQFQNGQPITGALFLGSEVLAVSLSIGFFAAVEDLRLSNGRFASEDVGRATTIQNAQLVSGGVALALMAAGVIHALATFEDDVDVQRRTIQPSPQGVSWTF